MDSYACLCCGYKTLSTLGSYLICPVCYWEDDPFQSDSPDLCGANNMSLRNAQRNYLELQVCDIAMKSFVRQPKSEENRDINWSFL